VQNTYAMAPRPSREGQARPAGSALGSFLPLILIFAVFYFLLIRPQQVKTKQHQQMLLGLKRGDKIVTSGGIYGEITQVGGRTVEIKVANGVKLTISKTAVAGLTPKEEIK